MENKKPVLNVRMIQWSEMNGQPIAKFWLNHVEHIYSSPDMDALWAKLQAEFHLIEDNNQIQ